MRQQNWLLGHFRAVAALFAFEEYDAPVVESEALYTRKAGEEITDQLYNFADKGGRRLALRPEMTPSLARMVLQKGGSLALPPQVVQHSPVLALRAHDSRSQARTLSVEYGHCRRFRSNRGSRIARRSHHLFPGPRPWFRGHRH